MRRPLRVLVASGGGDTALRFLLGQEPACSLMLLAESRMRRSLCPEGSIVQTVGINIEMQAWGHLWARLACCAVLCCDGAVQLSKRVHLIDGWMRTRKPAIDCACKHAQSA